MNEYNKAPVTEGETYDLKCISKGGKGDGICKKDKFVIIVPGAKINQTYKVKITKVTRRVAFGEIVA